MHPFYENQQGKMRVVITKNLSFPEHLHAHAELLYIPEGETQITIDHQICQMHAGDCALIFPGQLHSYQPTSPHRVYLLIFDPSLTGSFQYSLQNFRPSSPHLDAACVPDDIRLAVERLIHLDITESPALGSAWIQVILALLFPYLAPEKIKQSESEQLTYRLIHYMNEHFQEPLTLDSLSKALHVNKYYLSHTFSKKLRTSFPQYLNYLRLEYAAEAMCTSSDSLSRIWEEAGFTSQSSFNRAFREYYGLSPLRYRKERLSAQ